MITKPCSKCLKNLNFKDVLNVQCFVLRALPWKNRFNRHFQFYNKEDKNQLLIKSILSSIIFICLYILMWHLFNSFLKYNILKDFTYHIHTIFFSVLYMLTQPYMYEHWYIHTHTQIVHSQNALQWGTLITFSI